MGVEELESRCTPSHWVNAPFPGPDVVARGGVWVDPGDAPQSAPVSVGGGPVRVAVLVDAPGVDGPGLVGDLWADLSPFHHYLTVGEGMDWGRGPWTQLQGWVIPALSWSPYFTAGQASFVLDPATATVDHQPAVYAMSAGPGAEGATAAYLTHEIYHALGYGHGDDWSDPARGLATLAGFVERFAL